MKRKEVFTIFLRTLMPIIGLVLVLDLCLMQEEASSVPPPGETKTVLNAAAQLRDDLDQALGLLEECFGHPVDLQGVRSTSVTLTAYSSTVEQCDATPYLTASDQSVHVGIIAVSDDLMKELGLRFGQRVLIPGYGLFEIQDRMHPRWHRRVDIWQENSEVARRFGNRPGTIIWIDQQESPTRSAQVEGTSHT
jgi:3D (Asp-Asp-Asp) domain-containing protein